MLILGIECTAHTFGIGIVDSKLQNVIVNVKNVYTSQDSGMDPRKLTKYHVTNFNQTLLKAVNELKMQGLNLSNIDLISFSQGPGLGNSLKIGCLVAKTLSKTLQIPLVGVNHIQSHYEIGKMVSGFKNPLFVNITGVNSQVAGVNSQGTYVVYGETEDVGLGNCLDSCARIMGLGFPGGPIIDSYAKLGEELFELPYTIKGMNVAFSGIINFVKQRIVEFETKEGIVKVSKDKNKYYESKEQLIYDLSYSLVENCFAMIQEVAKRALCYTCQKELVLVGGVASSKRFCEMTTLMCQSIKVTYTTTPLSLCMDNGAMIAWLGYLRRDRATTNISYSQPKPYITVEEEPFVKNIKD
ncbi:MAG: tRNA (adenosine(37)-N6)-threonylcarbamoyltransferase complex transferase subunit TsaD [Nanoarchaeota archaeon]|nr:tRNA (adenosine(37)-N6)-threonylcarbamoyltransferase complex transferase subunit TsaD [Nanoarchaeota archaeon]